MRRGPSGNQPDEFEKGCEGKKCGVQHKTAREIPHRKGRGRGRGVALVEYGPDSAVDMGSFVEIPDRIAAHD